MKELSFEQMETTQGGKFWGRSCERSGDMYLAETNGVWECWQNWDCKYQVFWITVSSGTVAGGC